MIRINIEINEFSIINFWGAMLPRDAFWPRCPRILPEPGVKSRRESRAASELQGEK